MAKQFVRELAIGGMLEGLGWSDDLSFKGVSRKVLKVVIFLPKVLIVDALLGGLAEGLGLRGPPEIVWPDDESDENSRSKELESEVSYVSLPILSTQSGIWA
jgi:hypothetical protein